MNKTKRPYKHSETWLKKHAAKLSTKNKIEKSEKKMPNGVKRAKKSTKRTLKDALKIFNSTKKHVSNIKKCTKHIGKFLAETLKTGDEKYIAKVLKLFGRIGYVYAPEYDFVTFENGAKVKRPKVKIAADPAKKERRAKKQMAKKEENLESTRSVAAEPSTPNLVQFTNDDADEIADDTEDAENVDLANEEDEEIDDFEKNEDETDEEFRDRLEETRQQIREEREMEQNMQDEAEDLRDEIFAIQEENGDFS